MKNKITLKLVYFVLIMLVFGIDPHISLNAQYKALEASIDSLLQPGDITGFSAVLLKENKVVWSMVRGKADIENKIPVTENTLFTLASLTKSVTGAALMQLFEKGAFALDDDINSYLPFKIRNPNFPDIPITFRMLFTHTSSLTDVWSYISTLYGSGDQRNVSFGEIIRNSFEVKGKNYDPKNFLPNKPGEKWRYCNSNYVLIAYLVELLSKKSFPEYTKENIFKPLEMNETGWFFSNFDTTHIAVPYVNDTTDVTKKVRIGHYSWPGYSDGGLITSTIQYANFIKMLCNNGNYKGKQILKPETVSKILTPQNVKIPPFKIIPPMLDMGLTWMITKGATHDYFTHGGEGTGITSLAFFNPVTKVSVIMFMTGEYLREDREFAKNPKRYTSLLFTLFTKYLK